MRRWCCFRATTGGPANGDNGPWRGGKGTVFEGGTRVAAAIRWPTVLPAGKIVTEPIMAIDVLPTLMKLTGVTDHGGQPLDGVDVLPAIRGTGSTADREMFSSVSGNRHAVWSPPWKLVVEHRANSGRNVYLFDFASDPGETTNLAEQHPEVVDRLTARIDWFLTLQPEDHIADSRSGREGFKPPRNWDIRLSRE